MKTLVVENITKTFKISRKQQRIEKTKVKYMVYLDLMEQVKQQP